MSLTSILHLFSFNLAGTRTSWDDDKSMINPEFLGCDF